MLIRHTSEPDFTLEVIPDSVEGGSGVIYRWPNAQGARTKRFSDDNIVAKWSAQHGRTWKKRVNVERPGFLLASQTFADGSITWSDPVLIISEIGE